jgi:iron complex transport system permease protein
MRPNPKFPLFLILASACLAGLFFANISLGSVRIPFSGILQILSGNDHQTTWSNILWQFRLPKALTCVIAGSALACSGLLMQSLFRNPLAGPDVLGLSAGASLAVALVILAGTTTMLPLSSSPWSIALAATIGCVVVFLAIISIAQRIKDNVSLLIIGLMISAATSAFVSVLQFLSKAEDLQAFVIWTMGSVGGTDWNEIRVLALLLLVGISISIRTLKSLNAFLLGENYSQSIGINFNRSRFWVVLATSIMTGGVTAFCGPIAFVGLAVPHLVKSFFRTSDHKILIPAVMIGGASLLLLCDILAQLPGSTQLLPLNAITSFVGAPVVIWGIMKTKRFA